MPSVKKKSRLQPSDKAWGAVAVVLIVLQFWWLPGEAGSAADSYSTSVDGKLGLFRLLSELFPDVRRDALSPVPALPGTMLLITPDRLPTDAEERAMMTFVYSGGQLVVAADSMTGDLALSAFGIRCRPLTRPPSLAEVSDTAADSSAIPPTGVPSPAPPAVEDTADAANPLRTGEAVTSVLTDDVVRVRCSAIVMPPERFDCETLAELSSGEVVASAWRLGRGSVLVVSAPDLFSNRSLLFAENRRLTVRLLEHVRALVDPSVGDAGPIVLAEYFNASDSFQQTGVLFSPMLRVATLQLLLAAVLGIWLAFHRFGPAEFVGSLQRRSLADSAVAVGNLQYRIRDGGFAVASYLEYIRSRIRGRFGSSLNANDAAAIAARSGLPHQEIREQFQEAKELSEAPQVSASKAAAMIRWLAKLNARISSVERPL